MDDDYDYSLDRKAFAAAALVGLCNERFYTDAELVKRSWAIADAMVVEVRRRDAERLRKEGSPK